MNSKLNALDSDVAWRMFASTFTGMSGASGSVWVPEVIGDSEASDALKTGKYAVHREHRAQQVGERTVHRTHPVRSARDP